MRLPELPDVVDSNMDRSVFRPVAALKADGPNAFDRRSASLDAARANDVAPIAIRHPKGRNPSRVTVLPKLDESVLEKIRDVL